MQDRTEKEKTEKIKISPVEKKEELNLSSAELKNEVQRSLTEHKKVPSSSAEFQVTLTKEDIICPITTEIFFDPVVVGPCGHSFEKEAINDWRTTKNTCPCCREPITSISADIFKNQIVEQILSNHPDLQNERHFNFQDFYECSNSAFNGKITNPQRMEKYVALLSNSAKELNAIREEKDYEGVTAAFVLMHVCSNLDPKEYLKNDYLLNPKLLKLITSESLNAKYKKNYNNSGIFVLTASNQGIEILINNPELQTKVTSDGLNAVSQEAYLGLTAVLGLVSCDSGRKFLVNNPVFRKLINPIGLNSISRASAAKDFLGRSAVYELARNIENDNNAMLLLSDPDIQSMIDSDSLNAEIPEEGLSNEVGLTAGYMLAASVKGQDLLTQNPKLSNKINKKSLNAMRKVGENRGMTTFYNLAKTCKGYEFLLNHPVLCEQVDSKSLNMIIPAGCERGYSAAFWLCYPDAKALLMKHPKLRHMMEAKSLNANTPRGSAVTRLCAGPAEIELLAIDPELCSKINSEGLNAIIKEEHLLGIGMSAVYGLLKHPEGHKLLLNKPHLIELISKEALFSIVKTAEDSPDNGKTAAYWLLNAKTPESEELLKNPILRMKLGLPEKEAKQEIQPSEKKIEEKKELAERRYPYFQLHSHSITKVQLGSDPLSLTKISPVEFTKDLKNESAFEHTCVPFKEKKQEAESLSLLVTLQTAIKEYKKIHYLSFGKTLLEEWDQQLKEHQKNEKQVVIDVIKTFHKNVREYKGIFSNKTYDVVGKEYIEFLDRTEGSHIIEKAILALVREFAPRELDLYNQPIEQRHPVSSKLNH